MNCRVPPRHPFSGYLVHPASEQPSSRAPSPIPAALAVPASPSTGSPTVSDGAADGESCDYCGSMTLTWRKCKLICTSCAQINKSCADL